MTLPIFHHRKRSGKSDFNKPLNSPGADPLAKLKDLSVNFLSLVKTPATGKGLTLKSAKQGDRFTTFEITKTNDELMRAYGIVYAPDQVDAHGDSADAATIRKAQAEFMREGRLHNIDTEHSFTPEVAFVAESWLVRKGDDLFPAEPEGAWAVGIQIGDPDLWRQLKSGEMTGISLAGIARVEPSQNDQKYTEKSKDAAPGWVERLIKALIGADNQDPIEENDMDKKAVQEIVRDTLKSELGDAIKDALKSAGVGGTADPAPAAAPAADPAPAPGAESEGSDIEKAIAKGFTALEGKIDDKITKALAKGAIETGPVAGNVEESFL